MMIRKIVRGTVLMVLLLFVAVAADGGTFVYGSGVVKDNTAPIVDQLTLTDQDYVDLKGEMTVDINITEEGSGVNEISAVFQNTKEENDQIAYEIFNYLDNNKKPLFSGEHSLSVDMTKRSLFGFDDHSLFQNGSYEMIGLTITDRDNNTTNYCDADYYEDDGSFIDIDTICQYRTIYTYNAKSFDYKAPRIKTVAVQNAKKVDGGKSIKIVVDVVEEGSGVERIDFMLEDKEVAWGEIEMSWIAPNQSSALLTGKHTIEIPLKNVDVYNGKYEINEIHVRDRARNSKTYNRGEGPLETPVEFNVINADSIAPSIKDIKFKEKELTVPNVWNATVNLPAKERRIKSLEIWMSSEEGYEIKLNVHNDSGWKGGWNQIKIPVGPFVREGKYTIDYIEVSDGCKTTQEYRFDNVSLTIKAPDDPLDIVYYSSMDNLNGIMKALQTMTDGQGAMIDCSNCKIIPKEVFEAIAGKNITLIFQDDDVQWAFNGNNITEDRCKDIDITTRIHAEDGSSLGLPNSGKVLVIDFMDNGILPGEAEVRVNNEYISAKYAAGDKDLMLSFVKDGKATIEDPNVPVDSDEAAVLRITHNSKGVIHGKVTIKSKHVNVKNTKIKSKPSVTIALKGVKKGRHYKIRYGNYSKVGTATVTITGIKTNGYRGKITKKYKVKPRKPQKPSVTSGKNKLIVKCKGLSKTGGSKFKVYYKQAGKSGWKGPKTTKSKVTIKGLKSGKKYKIKVIATGEGLEGSSVTTKAIKVK